NRLPILISLKICTKPHNDSDQRSDKSRPRRTPPPLPNGRSFHITRSRHMSRLLVISMHMWSERQTIEIFHLLFLRAFGARMDKALFALKGGCNLRFFLKSIRYSEDMDLEIHTMSVGTLRNNVNRLLETPAFLQALRAQGIELAR